MQNTSKVQDMFGFVSTSIVHLDDLYAGKMCAALDRQHPRDFFDIRGLIDNEGISDDLINVFIVYLISSSQPISKLLDPNLIDISKTYEEQFIGMTVKPIELSVLEETRKELISIVNEKLTDSHKEFLIGFKKGQPNWELLPFKNVRELPSVQWKQINLDRMDELSRQLAIEKLEKTLYR